MCLYIGIRNEVLQLLMCYDPLWLQLGLEVAFVVMIWQRFYSSC